MLYQDLPAEIKAELEEKKVAMGLWPAGIGAPRRFVNLILCDKDSSLVAALGDHGYVRSTVSNWFNKTVKSYIGDNEKCLRTATEALSS